MGKLTIFKSIDSDSQSQHLEISEILSRIKSGTNQFIIHQIRNETNKQQRDFLKKKLMWICFSGTFSKRNNESMIEHSGFMCLDFDGIPEKELLAWKEKLKANPYTYACFVSPSGNGLKTIWKIPICQTNEEHNLRFDAIADIFSDCRYFDRNVKGWSRVCFESYDRFLYVNEDAQTYTGINEPIKIKTPTVTVKSESVDVQKTFDKLIKWFESKHNMRKGNRNQGAFTFASGVAEYLSQSSAEPMLTNYIMQNVEQPDGDPFTIRECETCIIQAYRANPTPRKEMNNHTVQSDEPNVCKDFIFDESELPIDQTPNVFWYSGKTGLKVDYLALKYFLEGNGFWKYRFNPEDISFIRIQNQIVSVVTVDEIRDFTLKFLIEQKQEAAYNLFAESSKFDKKYLALLDEKKPRFIKDGKNDSWIFYQNTAVRITAKGTELISYKDVDGYIWRNQILMRDASIADYKGDFSQFLLNVSGQSIDRTRSLLSAIGYMMHRFKDPSTVRALVINEEAISDEPAGGTGKGLIFQAIARMRVVIFINGKSFDSQKGFVWQRINPDTEVVVLDDIQKTFKVEDIFSILTTGWPIEKKNKGEIYLLPEDSPKIGIPTNNVLKGHSSSHERRKFEVEFYPHYSENHQPIDDFGKTFWNEWDAAEWLRFDNLMWQCLRLYLEFGFLKVEFVNLKYRKLTAECSTEFAEYATHEFKNNARYNRNDQFKQFMFENPGSYCKSSSQFYEWMRHWGQYNDWQMTDCGTGRMWMQFGEVSEAIPEKVIEEVLPF
jgi:hypothetical protein